MKKRKFKVGDWVVVVKNIEGDVPAGDRGQISRIDRYAGYVVKRSEPESVFFTTIEEELEIDQFGEHHAIARSICSGGSNE